MDAENGSGHTSRSRITVTGTAMGGCTPPLHEGVPSADTSRPTIIYGEEEEILNFNDKLNKITLS